MRLEILQLHKTKEFLLSVFDFCHKLSTAVGSFRLQTFLKKGSAYRNLDTKSSLKQQVILWQRQKVLLLGSRLLLSQEHSLKNCERQMHMIHQQLCHTCQVMFSSFLVLWKYTSVHVPACLLISQFTKATALSCDSIKCLSNQHYN